MHSLPTNRIVLILAPEHMHCLYCICWHTSKWNARSDLNGMRRPQTLPIYRTHFPVFSPSSGATQNNGHVVWTHCCFMSEFHERFVTVRAKRCRHIALIVQYINKFRVRYYPTHRQLNNICSYIYIYIYIYIYTYIYNILVGLYYIPFEQKALSPLASWHQS